MRTFLKTCVGAPFLKNASWRHYTDVFDVKILESRAKSFYKLKNIKLLKRNITGLCEVENLKITYREFSQEKKNKTDETKK